MTRYPLDNWKAHRRGYTFWQPTSYSPHHLGLDISCEEGSSLYAPDSGIITNVTTGPQGGRTIWLRTHKNIVMRFLHLSEFLVSNGDTVDGGQLIGRTGNTGLSTGPHLHCDLWLGKIDLSLPPDEQKKLLLDPEIYFDQLVQQNMDLTQYENQFIRKGSAVEYGFVVRGKKYVWPNDEKIEALILALEKQKKIDIKKIDPVVWNQIPNSTGLQF